MHRKSACCGTMTFYTFTFFQISAALKCPVTKFITHTLSHFVFLFLLAVATFGLEEILYEHGKSFVTPFNHTFKTTSSSCAEMVKFLLVGYCLINLENYKLKQLPY